MSKARKRIEALSELFMSEKAYIDDMTIWQRDFRRDIIGYPFLSLKIKYEICDLVFINMHEIVKLHKDIFNDMKERNIQIKKLMEPGFVEDPDDDGFILDKEKSEVEELKMLEYATVYFKHASRFVIYEEYARRLPRAEFELEKICHFSFDFKKSLQNFMTRNNIEFLGTRHFLYRPSQKLARYSLLLKAVQKNTEIVTYDKYYGDLIEEIKFITKNVDRVFNRYSTQFKIYRLDQQLKYRKGVKNQLCLGLFQKRRRLLKEGDILVKNDLLFDPFILKVYIFDHAILLCDIPQGEFQNHFILDDPIFISKIILFTKNLGFYPESEKLASFFPLYILETTQSKVRCFYFEDVQTRNIYLKVLRKAIKKIKSRFDSNIKLDKLTINSEMELNNACQSSSQDYVDITTQEGEEQWDVEEESWEESTLETSLSDSNEDLEAAQIDYKKEESLNTLYNEKELKRAITEFTSSQMETSSNPNQWKSHLNTLAFGESVREESLEEENIYQNSQESWFKRFCYSNDFFNRSFTYEIDETQADDLDFLRRQDEMILTSGQEGIAKIVDGKTTYIYNESVTKVLYDSIYQAIIFQSGSTLYIAHFNCEMESFEKIALKNDIGDFFYGTTKRGSYIASRNYGGGKSSLIYLFLIEKNEKTIKIELSRKLYVGFKVYNIFFSKEKIVIACKDFEVVDMDTLRTEELLESYDPFISIFFRNVPLSRARAVFPITPKTFLLCFDSIGFIVDILGRVKTTEKIFLWNCLPVDFKVFYNFVICLGKKCVDVYDLKTGHLVFTHLHNNLKFVGGTNEPFLHDNNNFYIMYM